MQDLLKLTLVRPSKITLDKKAAVFYKNHLHLIPQCLSISILEPKNKNVPFNKAFDS